VWRPVPSPLPRAGSLLSGCELNHLSSPF
jgi:hypothetical protein